MVEDLEDNDVKDSWEDFDEPAPKNVVFNWLEKWNSLPEEVKWLIINKLNMLEVFRLGNVCKDFSALWKGLRNLDFGADVMKLIYERGFNFGDITSRIVSPSGLNGPVDSFHLCMDSISEPYQEVGRWLEFLSKNHVKSLAVGYDCRFDEPTPSSDILKCTDLQHLSLNGFNLVHLGDFQGFANLISLKLDSVTISPNLLQDILAKSPLLEKFHIGDGFVDGPMVMDTCMLKTFHWDIGGGRLCLRGKCSNLSVVRIYSRFLISAEVPGKNKLNQFFNIMPNIEFLTLTWKALLALARDDVPGRYDRLNACLQNLKQLDIRDLQMHSFECIACAFCIIRCSPNLQTLSISTFFGGLPTTNEENEIFYENQGSALISSSLLEFNMDSEAAYSVQIYSELLMVKTMLRCCPALDTVCLRNVVGFSDRDEELSYIESVLGYPRPESTIIKFDLTWPT